MPKVPEFFEGGEALQEVAKPEGLWNWCLLGPDAKTLPLVAGGFGFVECMRDVIGKHPHTYGLLRLSFGKGTTVFHRWVKVDAADEVENAARGTSAVTKGKAAAQKPEMAIVFREYSSAQVTVTIRSKEECTAAHVIEALLAGGTADKDRLTVQENKAAIDEFTDRFFHDKEGTLQEEEVEEEHNLAVDLEHAMVKDEENATHVQEEKEEEKPESKAPAFVRQRSKLWVPKVDEPVKVYSRVTKVWYDDGWVTHFAMEPCRIDGMDVPAGAVKVIFNENKTCKWVRTENITSMIAKSERPFPPRTVSGQLLKETHGLMTVWNKRHCVLKRGCLRWWEFKDHEPYRPNGLISLFGMKLKMKRTVITLRSASSTAIYKFDVTERDLMIPWVDAFIQHGKYCDELQRLHRVVAQQVAHGDL